MESEDGKLVLPHFKTGQSSILDQIDLSLVEVNQIILKGLSNEINCQTFKNLSKSLMKSLESDFSFLSGGLQLIFSREALFLDKSSRENAIVEYSKILSSLFNQYYLEAESKDDRIELVANLWVLFSPIHLLSTAAVTMYPKNPVASNVLVDRLTFLVESRFGIKDQGCTRLELIQKFQPLLRPIEQEDRTSIMVEFIAFERDNLGVSNPTLWLDFTETITALTGQQSVSVMQDAYQFGKSEEPHISSLIENLNSVKGISEKEDRYYQDFANYQLEEIKKGIIRVKIFIAAADGTLKETENEILDKLCELQNEIILRITLLINLGAIVYETKNLVLRIKTSFIDMLESEPDRFDAIALSVLMPIGVVSERDSTRPELQSAYLNSLKKLAAGISDLSLKKLNPSFSERLLSALSSPIRTFVSLGLIGLNEIVDPSTCKEGLNDYELQTVMQYEITKIEQQMLKIF